MAKKQDQMEIMVFVANPEDFLSWPDEAKLARYERVMEWHDFVRRNNPDTIPYVWGTHQVLSQSKLSNIHSLFVVVYRMKSLFEFDRLMEEDPLRDMSRYTTWVLSPLEDDHHKDLVRFNRLRTNMFGSRSPAEADKIPAWRELRSLYIQAPEYVGKYRFVPPPNPITPYDDKSADYLEVLVSGTNPPDFMSWSDAKQLISYEKVLWWADYVSMLIHKGLVSHAWTGADFCDSGGLDGVTENAQVVYRVNDMQQFGDLYSLDPLRLKGAFWSIVLQPIARQREIDEARLKRARARSRKAGAQRAG